MENCIQHQSFHTYCWGLQSEGTLKVTIETTIEVTVKPVVTNTIEGKNFVGVIVEATVER
jgi:hypothetical protein